MFIFLIFLATIIVAIASFFIKEKRDRFSTAFAGIFAVLVIIYSFVRFSSGYTGGFISRVSYSLAPSIGINFTTGVSGFTDALLILSVIVIFISTLIAEKKELDRLMFSYILTTEVGLIGVLISRDFLFFYIFWEVVLIPVYFMIAQFGKFRKESVGLKFFVYTHIGSVFLLLSIFAVYTYNFDKTGVLTFEIGSLMTNSTFSYMPAFWRDFTIFGFLFAFLVKMPVFPLHSWLPDSYESAPYPATVILSGGLSLMGGLGLFGILLPVTQSLGTFVLSFLIGIGIVSLIYFALAAMMQSSLKRMMALASAASMGFVVLAFGAGGLETGYEKTLELSGGMFQIVAHGLIMAFVFSALYFIKRSTGKENIQELGGIFRETPFLASFLLAGLLASLGLPGMAGFVGEFSVLVGSFQAIGWVILFVIFGMILTASYHIWAAQRSLYGPYNENLGRIRDSGTYQTIVLGASLIVILILGIFPNLLFGLLTAYSGGL
ncbi:MAG: NADH-quinone oxidoreductase subunit M [Thermoplasmataceae archaeon]